MEKIILFLSIIIFTTACQTDLKERAAKECKEYTEKKCPTPEVNNTSLDSIVFDRATTTIQYYYRLSGPADNDKAIAKQRLQLRKMLADALRSDVSTQAYKEAGFSFLYIYCSTKSPQKILLSERFTKEDL